MAKKNISPAGNLDLENDPLAIKSGDYRGALDVTPISDGNGNTVSYEPVIGNALAYDIGAAFAQEKIVRFTLPLGAVGAPIPPVFDLYFSRPCYVPIASSIQFISDSSPAILYSNAAGAISGAIPSASISAFTTDGVSITFNVAILGSATYENFWDWSVTNNPSATALATFLTIQEAIDAGSAGLFKPINFFDLLGNQYYFGATVSDALTEVPITAVLDDGTGLVQLTVPNNGIVDGTAISINGVTDGLGNSLAGEWIAYKKVVGGTVDLDNIVLVGSAFNAPYTILPTAHINTNYNSVGCIGVAQEDVYNNSFNNWNLIQSKKLNFRTKKQIHSYLENDTLKTSLYFTDDFNPIRVMYYYGEFMTNGFLTFVNPEGRYDYDTIGIESRLFLGDTDAVLTYDRTNDASGQLLTGNYRYTARFITEYQTVSPWLPLSDIINIYSYVNDGTQATIQTGDPDGTISTKTNTITITSIASGFYKYIEIGYVLYQGIAQSAFSIGQQLITGSTMTITHTGFETTSPLDFGTLVSADTGASYITAKSIDALNNRLIISNLTTQQVTDFSAFFDTWTHSLVNEEIEGMGVNNVGGDTGAGGNPGNDIYASYGNPEYFNPNNTYSKKGFIHNETYRFGARVKLKNGKFLSNIFWIDDIRIDTSIDNLLANPTSNRRVPFLAPYPNGTNSGGGLVDYSIYYAPNTNPLITKIKWGNIDWNFIVGGQRVIDVIETIYVYQVEMTSQYKEILGTGIYLLYTNSGGGTAGGHGNGWNPDAAVFWPNLINYGLGNVAEYNYFSGCAQANLLNYNYNNTLAYSNFYGRHYAAFYSPDVYFNNEQINLIAGNDKLLGCELNVSSMFNIDPGYQMQGGTAFTSRYCNIYGPLSNTSFFDSANLIEQKNIAEGGSAVFSSTSINVFKTIQWEIVDTDGTKYKPIYGAPASPVFYFDNNFPDNTNGMKYAQYYRAKGYYVKFGPKAESVYVPTGSLIHSPRVANTGTLDTYGDAFVQGQYLRLRIPPSGSTTTFFPELSWGYGCLFYSQNRVNSQMRYPQGGATNRNLIAPGFGESGWGRPSGSPNVVATQYTQSYTNRNQLNQLAAYDPNVIETNKYPTRIAYSQNKPNGSFTDPYRTFLLVDCRDLEQVNGEIVHHCISNGELLTWQQRSFQRQYFQSNGMFPNLNGSEVILGDGAALSRRGLTLSSIGCSNKWSVVKGASKGGNDVVSWWNTEYGYVVRFGYDGVNPISVVHNINGFIDKNTKWSALRDTPADDEGIHGVWNDERKEYIWTSRARRNNKGLYNPNEYYVAGDSVYDYSNGNQTPAIYIALQNTMVTTIVGSTTVTTSYPLSDPNYWSLDTDPKHRNEYTLCFNELKNGFVCNYSFIPKIYGKWKKGYVSSSPFQNSSIFIHNRGDYASWYLQSLLSNPFMLGVMNEGADVKKDFVAIELNSQVKPSDVPNKAMEFFTEQHYSYLDLADFDSDELHDILWSSWIKNDATVTVDNPLGLNDLDTSSMFGQYLLWKYYFKQGVYNKLFEVNLKFEPRTRLNNT